MQSFEEFKDEWDRKLVRVIARMLMEQRRRVVAVIGEEIKAARDVLSDEYWEEERQIMARMLRRPLRQLSEAAIERLEQGVPRRIDLQIVNQRMLQWVHDYSFRIIDDINSTTRRAIQASLDRYFSRPGMTFQDIADELEQSFGVVRAERIAITETTRAIDMADQVTMEEVARAGFRYTDVWLTRNDKQVCDDCMARHDKPSEEWETDERPPLHVNCHCRVMHEIAE